MIPLVCKVTQTTSWVHGLVLVSVFNVNQDAAANVIIMYGTFVKLEKVKVLAKSVRFNL